MASSQLLDINVDELFEHHSIAEIDRIQNRLLANVDEKKQELRIMVGERYRDLLHAADTIGEMRQTSIIVIEHVEDIMSSCRRLNDQQLIGFKLPPTRIDNQFDKSVTHYYGIVAQIRLLTALPELIWSRLDTKDYFVATQLFILSRHISTGLQLETNSDVMRKLRVAKRQWNILSQFYFTIKQLCLDALEDPELDVYTAAKCLAAIQSLENCPTDKMLILFTQSRAHAFRKIIKPDFVGLQGSKQTKEKILAGLKMLNNTLVLLSQCFISINNDTCFLDREMRSITDPDAPPTISLIDMDDSVLTSTLPSMITKFKPHIQVTTITSGTVQSTMKNWLRNIEKDAKEYFGAIINDVGSVRTVHGIKTAANEIELPSNWSDALQCLDLPHDLNFYQSYCQPLVRDRIKDIINKSWESTVDKTYEQLTAFQNNNEIIWSTEDRSFWIEDSADTPLSLKQALSSDQQSHKLLMKAKGFCKEICQACELFDNNVAVLYKDLSLYLSAFASGQKSNQTDVDEKDDRAGIILFLSNCSQQYVERLIELIKSNDFETMSQQNLIFLARFLEALCEICPTFKLCLTQTLLTTSNYDEPPHTSCALGTSQLQHWQSMCQFLDNEAMLLWKRWLNIFISDLLQEHNGFCFSTNINFITLLTVCPNWDTIIVEEKDDQNQPIESVIRVPSLPSIILQDFLFICCDRLNRAVPSTLPKSMINLLTEYLSDKLRPTYRELLTAPDFLSSNQIASIQFYFDSKFLNMLLGFGSATVGDDSDEQDFNSLANGFKAYIDPFDFEMFHKYIIANVKKAIHRMRHQFGLLAPNYEHLITLSTQTNTLQDKEPNVLTLSDGASSANMFPLLPIVISTTAAINATASPVKEQRPVRVDKARTKKSPHKLNAQSSVSSAASSAQQNLANVKSNAAAFFGAMSQDWFR